MNVVTEAVRQPATDRYAPDIDMHEAGPWVVADTTTCKLQRGVMQLREGQFTTADARMKLKRLFPSL